MTQRETKQATILKVMEELERKEIITIIEVDKIDKFYYTSILYKGFKLDIDLMTMRASLEENSTGTEIYLNYECINNNTKMVYVLEYFLTLVKYSALCSD